MNLSLIGFRYARVVFALLFALMVSGVVSYFRLPANEDPTILIRQALIITNNPGLAVDKVELLITKPLELAVRQRPEVKKINSTSMLGQSIIVVEIFDKYFELDQIWDDVRQEIEQVRLPEGTLAPYMNDSFGDVSVMTVALLADDGFSEQEKTDQAKHIRDQLYQVTNTHKVSILGIQPERIYIDIQQDKLAELGYSSNQLAGLIGAQNIIQSAGQIDIDGNLLTLQPTGSFDDLSAVQTLLIPLANGQGMVALSDIADIYRAPVDPPHQPVFFNGEPALMLAVNMDPEANILNYTPILEAKLAELNQALPAGMRLEIATKQAEQVANAVYGVTQSVLQTLAIVLVVVMLFLGVRTGLIVGSVVPAVMLLSLAVMNISGLALQRMSLATLMIALGLLVENGIVIAEDFRQRLERGQSREDALAEGGRSLAMPLLTSSLTTILVFLPLMLAVHVAGEYTRSISIVITIVLLISWLLAMMVTPTLCYYFMKVKSAEQRANSFSIFDPIRAVYTIGLRFALRFRLIFLILVTVLLGFSIQQMSTVPQKFFPDSDRTQALVYLTLPAQTSMRETTRLTQEASQTLMDKSQFPNITSVAAYGGFGGPRFVLALTPLFPANNRAFMVINVDSEQAMNRVIDQVSDLFKHHYPDSQAQVMRMFLGPSDANVLQVRVSGPDADVLYNSAQQIEAILDTYPNTIDIRHNWENRLTELSVNINQQQAKSLGITSADIAQALRLYYDGMPVSLYRDGDESLPIILRAGQSERHSFDHLANVKIHSSILNTSVPLAQIADIQPYNTYSHIMRENLSRTILIEARNTKLSSEEFKPIIDADIQALAKTLPPNHRISYDGAIAQSIEAQQALTANIPLCIGIIIILLIAQFNSYRRALMVMLAIPMMMIGAVLGLKIMGAEFGFMVTLGLYALAGIIVNNAIVLIDRIDLERQTLDENDDHLEAVIHASVRRLRPIMMSTVTTTLGLLPLLISQDPLFYGMAAVIAFGLSVGALFTLGFTPVLYTLFFKIKRS